MAQYHGICVGGPYDKKQFAHNSGVLTVALYEGDAMKTVRNQAPELDEKVRTEIYFFEDFWFSDGRFGFWRHESIDGQKGLLERLAAAYATG